MKKIGLLCVTALVCLSLAACGNKNASNKSNSSSNTEKASSVKPSDQASNRTWTYRNNVFDAGIETYRFTKAEVRDSSEEGKKVLVLYCDVTNNSKKEQDPSNVYMVMHANQKNNTSDVQLNPAAGTKLDENGNDPLQKQSDNLNNKLLPGKTTHAVIMFTLQNNNPVKVSFQNADFETIGTKTYKVK